MNQSQNKERVVAYLPPEMIINIDSMLEQNNLKNKSEFIFKAVDFYIGYLNSQNSTDYINKTFIKLINGALRESENRHSGNLFRLSVEMSMMMNIIASGLEIEDDQLYKLRGRCVREVKNSKGKIAFENALAYQNSDS